MSTAVVQPIFKPDAIAMLAHLEHLFGGYLDGYHDGLVELVWTSTSPGADGKYGLDHAQLFGTDKLEALVTKAVALNSTPMCNVYIGAALRHPDTAPFARTKDRDAWALPAVYVDMDGPGVADAAKDVYGPTKPTLPVVTGRAPHTRAQLWWKLREPLTDPEAWPGLLRGIAVRLGGDLKVTNPGRVMRLAGSIAWPTKPGRSVEMTAIASLKEPGPLFYGVEHLERVFPPVGVSPLNGGGHILAGDVTYSTNSLGLADKINDGREAYMVRTIAACLIEQVGECHCAPTPQQLYNAAWPQYERHVDLTRSGRGAKEFMAKCAYTVRRFEAGAIRGAETVSKAVEIHKRKVASNLIPPRPAPPTIDNETGEIIPITLSAAQFVTGFTPPNYLLDGVLQRGYLYSLTARTGHGKTAVGMFMAQAIARGIAIHGREVLKGTVLLLAGENPDDIRARFITMGDACGFDPKTIPMRFVGGVIDIAASLATLQAEAIPDLVFVIVDTAAAYYPGDDANSNAQQGAYARLLRQLTFLPGKPAVMVACHPTKNASAESLVPGGGGAFMNEMDGNLTLWATAEKMATLHWQGKFRGPEFEPMAFAIKTITSEQVKDAKGRLMPSVIAEPIGDMAVEIEAQKTVHNAKALLFALHENPRASVRFLARKIGMVNESGAEKVSSVNNLLKRLYAEKLTEKTFEKYTLTAKGRREIGVENED